MKSQHSLQSFHALQDAESFNLRLESEEIVQLSFGATQIAMTLDAAYDLQYRLAGFLAGQDLADYPTEESAEDESVLESKKELMALVHFSDQRRFDA